MNFKMERVFKWIVDFLIGCFFLVSGLSGAILAWSATWQMALSLFIVKQKWLLSFLGLSLSLIGLAILAGVLLKTRHRYLCIRAHGQQQVMLDEAVVRHYLDHYWQKCFPSKHVPFELVFKKHSLQIVAHFPFLPLDEQKAFLEKAKTDLEELFGNVLGYPHDVHLAAEFQELILRKG